MQIVPNIVMAKDAPVTDVPADVSMVTEDDVTMERTPDVTIVDVEEAVANLGEERCQDDSHRRHGNRKHEDKKGHRHGMRHLHGYGHHHGHHGMHHPGSYSSRPAWGRPMGPHHPMMGGPMSAYHPMMGGAMGAHLPMMGGPMGLPYSMGGPMGAHHMMGGPSRMRHMMIRGIGRCQGKAVNKSHKKYKKMYKKMLKKVVKRCMKDYMKELEAQYEDGEMAEAAGGEHPPASGDSKAEKKKKKKRRDSSSSSSSSDSSSESSSDEDCWITHDDQVPRPPGWGRHQRARAMSACGVWRHQRPWPCSTASPPSTEARRQPGNTSTERRTSTDSRASDKQSKPNKKHAKKMAKRMVQEMMRNLHIRETSDGAAGSPRNTASPSGGSRSGTPAQGTSREGETGEPGGGGDGSLHYYPGWMWEGVARPPISQWTHVEQAGLPPPYSQQLPEATTPAQQDPASDSQSGK